MFKLSIVKHINLFSESSKTLVQSGFTDVMLLNWFLNANLKTNYWPIYQEIEITYFNI